MTATIHRLRASLAHLPGVGPSAELKAWRLGVVSWDDMRWEAKDLFSSRTADRVLTGIAESETALERGDIRYCLRRLPLADRIRVYPLIRDHVLFLDLETTGLSVHRHRITTAVTYDGRSLRAFIRDRNLEELGSHLRQSRTLVTFNGHRFDLPFLRRDLGLRLPQFHLDLCALLRARELCGGLKHLEQVLGVARPRAGKDEGKAAPVLWSRWRAGDSEALSRLLIYNAHDTLVLERLLVATLNLSMGACPVFADLPMPAQPRPETAQFLHDGSLTSE